MHRALPTLVAAAVVAAALFLFGLQLDAFWLRVIVKPIPAIIMAVIAMTLGRTSYARTIAAGLVACALGDLLLELTFTGSFVAGMVAFLIGHLCYTGAFVRRVRQPRLLESIPFLIWIVWAGVILWPHLGEMRVPVLVYTSAIFVMMWRANAVVASLKERGVLDWCVLLGAVTFAFSDTLIAINKFHTSIEGVRTPIILTYWLGQALITASVLRTHPREDASGSSA